MDSGRWGLVGRVLGAEGEGLEVIFLTVIAVRARRSGGIYEGASGRLVWACVHHQPRREYRGWTLDERR
jgi:hypothetical protein